MEQENMAVLPVCMDRYMTCNRKRSEGEKRNGKFLDRIIIDGKGYARHFHRDHTDHADRYAAFQDYKVNSAGTKPVTV